MPERVAMMMTGHKTRSVFERYNIVSEGDLTAAAARLDLVHRDNLGTMPAAVSLGDDPNSRFASEKLEAQPGFEPGMEVLQTSALPLGYCATAEELRTLGRSQEGNLERETGFEPATSTLARSHSTTELFPLTLATTC